MCIHNTPKETENESRTKEIIKSLKKTRSLLLNHLKETIKTEEEANISLTKLTEQAKIAISMLKKLLEQPRNLVQTYTD